MGRRGIRVILAVLLLGTVLGSISIPGAAADGVTLRTKAPGDLQLDGFWSSGTVHRPDRSTALDRGVEQGRSPQVVVGPDSRNQVADTSIFPYSAVAHLELYEANASGALEGVAICSSAMVGPNVLLTAAHCLWDETDFGGFVDRVVVVPGANGDIEPFGFVDAEWLWVPDAYTTNSDPGSPYDYGLIVLPTNDVEEQTGSFEIGILTTSELQDPNFNPTTAGYPGDKPFGTQWVSSEASFNNVDDVELEHSIDAVQGQSGSPVWRASDMAIVGVESTESETANFAIRLDVPIMYELMEACQELDCKINHFLTDIPGDGAAFDRVWERTDLPVASGAQARTWMWGPDPISKVMFEPYVEAPNGFRTVLYQEKSRMEITDPNADSNSIWYVTNGLATVELMTGNLQLGNNTFEQHEPAQINVAGDGDDPNGPTYATFAGLRSLPPHGPVPTSGSELAGGPTIITATVDRAGTVGDDPSLASEGVTAAHFVPETQHFVASVFWDFMNSSGTVWQNGQFVNAPLFDNAFFATGFPVTEAYWARVRVGGNERTVLVQAFERRVLTYTPGNPEGFLVEAGNVGAHYYSWVEQVTLPESSNGGGQPPPDNPPPDNPPPAIGDLIAEADLTNWPEVETTFGDTGMPTDDGYRVRNPPTGFLQLLADGSFGDAYYTVDTRAAQISDTGGASCLVYRADPFDDNPLFLDVGYWFCIFYENQEVLAAAAIYETTTDIIDLGGVEFLEPRPAASDWHQIGVVADGSEFWFVFDDVVLGSIVHDVGPGTGQVGLLSFNFDDTEGGPNAVYDYRNLQIYAIGNAAP